MIDDNGGDDDDDGGDDDDDGDDDGDDDDDDDDDYHDGEASNAPFFVSNHEYCSISTSAKCTDRFVAHV